MSDAVKITKVGRTVTGVMEPMMDGSFRETSYEGNLWRCEECGLVWDKKWYAETCAQREHATSFQQGPYGVTGTENGKLVGNPTYYTRSAIRRDRI